MSTKMKTVAVILIVAVFSVAQGSLLDSLPNLPNLPNAIQNNSVISSLTAAFNKVRNFKDFSNLSPKQQLDHIKLNCNIKLSNDTITKNIGENIQKFLAAVEGKGFEEGVTCLTAYSRDEFKQTFLTARLPEQAKNRPSEVTRRRKRQTTTAPASVDWRTKGYVSAVQDQGSCGSCWTFSANGAMEGAIKAKTGTLVNLSEQNLVDCVNASSGCNGGWMTDAYDYSKSNGGVDSDSSYPYVAKNQTCNYKAAGNAGKVTSYKYTVQNDETDLKNKVATVGPIAAAIDATYIQSYTGGIITCPKYTDVNHGILIVGYGTNATSGQDFWIVKNSWGPNWGESGYMRIIRNKGVSLGCGLAGYANYPIA